MINLRNSYLLLARIIPMAIVNLCLLSLLNATISTFGLMLMHNQNVKAQDRRSNGDNLEQLLQKTKRAKTIAEIPPAFINAVKKIYDSSPGIQKETKFEPYLASRYFWTMEAIELKSGYKVNPDNIVAPMCADGACDAPLDPSVWVGAWTGGTPPNISNANLPIGNWTSGLLPNDNSILPTANCGLATPASPGIPALQAHHSIVPAGNDPIIPSLKTVAPTPSNIASLRLGNQCKYYGGERVSRTFTVPAGQPTLQFWYATVLEDPGHFPPEQPGFGVYLFNGSTPVVGKIDIDPATPGNQEFIVADRNNPFFGYNPNLGVVYRDWSCVTIDLSGLEGQTLTLILVNRDCTLGGHFGYTYVDSFCVGCENTPTGDVKFNPARSDCVEGEICFDYTVPKLPNGTTGTVNVTLELFQNGVLQNVLTSGALTTNGTYCFSNFLSSLNPTLGYDWRAVANFSVTGATISPKVIGVRGEGFVAGINNDCAKLIDPCCPPWNKNRLAEMMFYQGQGSISDPYTLLFKPTPTFINQMQNYINYLNSVNSAMAHITIEWRLHDRGTGNLPSTTGTIPQIGFGSSTTWNAGGNGNITFTGPPIFSTPTAFPMQVGTWYNVYTVMYLNNGQKFFPEECSTNEIFVRIQVLFNRGEIQSVLEFSDGKNVIERIPIEP